MTERGRDDRVDDPRVRAAEAGEELGQPDGRRRLLHILTVRRRRSSDIDLRGHARVHLEMYAAAAR